MTHQILNARYHEQEASIIAQAGRLGAITISTNMAGRGTDIQLGGSADMRIQNEIPQDAPNDVRLALIKKITQEVEAEKKKVIEAGGLLVIGTERHDSRRIDNQLRGRAGRQGDPGKSRFYLSFEDDLLRVFGGDKLKALFQKIGLEEDKALENTMLSKTIIRTQQKVEQRNYDARRNLMKFDDIMNEQRSVVFKLRRELLEKENYQDTILEMIKNYVIQILPEFCDEKTITDEWDIEGLTAMLTDNLGMHNYGISVYLENDGIDFKKLQTFLTDVLIAIYKKKIAQWPAEVMTTIHREVVLRPLDFYWREHLNLISHISKIINFRGYGQKDPLIEFKKEAFESFSNFLGQKRQDTLRRIFRVEVDLSQIEANQTDDTPEGFLQLPDKFINPETGHEVSFADYPRNALCPCGSGKKFKHCHGSPDVLARSMV
ncbi:MAG: preprotein translocase subunit SecA [Dasania sp.]